MSEERAVQEVMARYVRATDRRDGGAVAAEFLPEGRVAIFHKGIVTRKVWASSLDMKRSLTPFPI